MGADSPAPPGPLGEAGQAYWSSIVEDIAEESELSPKELMALYLACLAVDQIVELGEVVARDGKMIAGSKGQLIVHPATAEIRQQKLAWDRLMHAVGLPEDRKKQERFLHDRATAGATGRWLTPVNAVGNG